MKNVKMILFLMIISTICIGLLGGVESYYNIVAMKILNEQLYKFTLDMFGISFDGKNYEQIFKENFKTVRKGNTDFYVATGEGKGSILFTEKGPGLWSTIELLVAIAPDYDHLYGMRVLSHGETPGLGGRIEEPLFQASFSGKGVRPEIKLLKITSNENEVDAITGATKTSTSVAEIINKAVAKLDHVYLERD